MKKLLTYIIILISAIPCFSQQDYLYNQYVQNPLLINPAYTGTSGAIDMVLMSRSQWVGFLGAPATQSFTIHGPLWKKTGVGLQVVSDKQGPLSSTNISGSAAYMIPLSKGKLSIGLKGGLLRYAVAWDEIEYSSGTQPYRDKSVNVASVDIGLLYYSKRIYIGAAVSHLSRPGIMANTTGNDDQGYIYRHFNVTTGYNFFISKTVTFKPSTLFRYVKNSPAALDINASFMFNEKFWVGTGFRPGYGAIFLSGVKLMDKLKIGYSNDVPMSGITGYAGASHEIIIGYSFMRKTPEIKLHLITEDGVILKTTTLSKEEYFLFKGLTPEKNYLFILECEDPELIRSMAKVQIRYASNGEEKIITVVRSDDERFRYTHLPYSEPKLYAINKGDTIMAATRNKAGYFVFTLLPDHPDYIFVLDQDDTTSVNEMDIVLNGKNVNIERGEGSFFRYRELSLEDVKLYLVNANGDTLDNGSLNEDGFFVFAKLPDIDNYIFTINARDAGLIDKVQVMSVDAGGKKVIITASKGKDKFFRYKKLEYEIGRAHV